MTKTDASLFGVSIRTVQCIWKRTKQNFTIDVSHRRTKNCGRKIIQVDIEQFRKLHLPQRTTPQSASSAMKISNTTLFKHLKAGVIRRHSNSIKPLLKDENKKSRVQFCLKMLENSSLPYDPKFKDMNNIIHIDEKWFYLTKKMEKYYIVANEDEPHRTCKSKNFVTKVMFLAVVARPRFDEKCRVTFSGKIGIWQFVTKEPAKRTSVNRIAGTLETKVMTSVGKDTIRAFLIKKILPAIHAEWLEGNSSLIFIQQDNARTHLDPNDAELRQTALQDGYDIRLMCQPTNSPDFNILDLGFFNEIQSL